MSGHSKWSKIKHKKAIEDQKKGKIFTILANKILVAVREGGPDVEKNFKLGLAIGNAKQHNMPKNNIERAIKKGSGKGDDVDEIKTIIYEGYGPGKTAILVEAITDNNNRSVASIKRAFDAESGKLGEPGCVAYLFKRKGDILVEKSENKEDQMLKLIDLGIDDVIEIDRGMRVLTIADDLAKISNKIKEIGFKIQEASLSWIPDDKLKLDEKNKKRVERLIQNLMELDDVDKVFSNLEL